MICFNQTGHFYRDYFKLVLKQALKDLQPNNSAIAAKILRSGYATVPNFFCEEAIDKFSKNLPDISDCRLSPEGTETRFFSDAEKIPNLQPFFHNPMIRDTARQIIGKDAHQLRSTVLYRTRIGKLGSFEQFFHMDTWRPRFKAFLYITDVTDDTSPLVYLPKSHKGLWRAKYDREIFEEFEAGEDGYIYNDISAYVGCFWPHQINHIACKLKTEPESITGKRGTLVLFDARGLHCVKPLKKDKRIILSSYWTAKDKHT